MQGSKVELAFLVLVCGSKIKIIVCSELKPISNFTIQYTTSIVQYCNT